MSTTVYEIDFEFVQVAEEVLGNGFKVQGAGASDVAEVASRDFGCDWRNPKLQREEQVFDVLQPFVCLV